MIDHRQDKANKENLLNYLSQTMLLKFNLPVNAKNQTQSLEKLIKLENIQILILNLKDPNCLKITQTINLIKMKNVYIQNKKFHIRHYRILIQ